MMRRRCRFTNRWVASLASLAREYASAGSRRSAIRAARAPLMSMAWGRLEMVERRGRARCVGRPVPVIVIGDQKIVGWNRDAYAFFVEATGLK